MESSTVGTKGQVVFPQKIRAMFHIEARNGEIVLTLRLWFDSAFRPRSPSLRIPPLTPRYFEKMAGCLGTSGKALKLLLEEKKQERAL